VDKAISVISAFGQDAQIGVGVSELARRAGLSKSTTFRLLGMLERNGVVERAGTAYRLGPTIRELGDQASTKEQDLIRDVLTPFLADLYEATHFTVQLAVLSGTEVVYLNKLEGHRRLRTPSRIGGRMPAYCTAVGKILLAHDPDAFDATLKRPRHQWTDATITDEDELRAELWKVRKDGVAIDRGESLDSLLCIAAPVAGRQGEALAALSVSGDVDMFRPEQHEGVLRRICYGASVAAARIRAVAAA
jgi:DNA-binding IclR family transcriptional regulator